MNCENIETLLAEAVGGELSPMDRAEFESHLASCDQCRAEFDALRATVGLMQKLPGPEPAMLINARRYTTPAPVRFAPPSSSRPTSSAERVTARLFRAAAGLVFAFLAGYGARYVQAPVVSGAQVVSTNATADMPTPGSSGTVGVESVRRAFMDARVRYAEGSDLARCLIALSGRRG